MAPIAPVADPTDTPLVSSDNNNFFDTPSDDDTIYITPSTPIIAPISARPAGVNFVLYNRHLQCLFVGVDKVRELKAHLEFLVAGDRLLGAFTFQTIVLIARGEILCYQIWFNRAAHTAMAVLIRDAVHFVMHGTGLEGFIDLRRGHVTSRTVIQ